MLNMVSFTPDDIDDRLMNLPGREAFAKAVSDLSKDRNKALDDWLKKQVAEFDPVAHAMALKGAYRECRDRLIECGYRYEMEMDGQEEKWTFWRGNQLLSGARLRLW